MKMLAVVGNFKEQCNGLYVEKKSSISGKRGMDNRS